MKIIIDLDLTLTLPHPGVSYSEARPNRPVIDRLHYYKELGFEIVIFTARNMRSYDGQIGKINVHTLPTILDWLRRHKVPHDEVIVGKPWCGPDGFYVDDRALRPDEFCALSYDKVRSLLKVDAN